MRSPLPAALLALAALSLPLLAPPEGAACPARTLQTRSAAGRLILKGATNKGRYLIAIRTGRGLINIVTTPAQLREVLGGGAMPRNGAAVRVTYATRQFPAQGFCLRANFLVGGNGGGEEEEDAGELTGLTYAFAGKNALKAVACQGEVEEARAAFEDVRKACRKRDPARALTLSADGSGTYTGDGGAHHVTVRWKANEFEPGAVDVLTNGRMRTYNVYDERYFEGAGGPDDGLPPVLKVE